MEDGKDIVFIKKASDTPDKVIKEAQDRNDNSSRIAAVKEFLKKIIPNASTASILGAVGVGSTAAALGSIYRKSKPDKKHSLISNPTLLGITGALGGYYGGAGLERLLNEFQNLKKTDKNTLVDKIDKAVSKSLDTAAGAAWSSPKTTAAVSGALATARSAKGGFNVLRHGAETLESLVQQRQTAINVVHNDSLSLPVRSQAAKMVPDLTTRITALNSQLNNGTYIRDYLGPSKTPMWSRLLLEGKRSVPGLTPAQRASAKATAIKFKATHPEARMVTPRKITGNALGLLGLYLLGKFHKSEDIPGLGDSK